MSKTGAHGRRTGRHTGRWLMAGIGVLVLAGAAAAVWSTQRSDSTTASATPKPKVVPLEVVGTTPATNATDVLPSTTITVDFSTALQPGGPMPSLSPPVAGTWSASSPSQLQFVAAGPLVPGSTETLTVPGGASGLTSTQGKHLDSTTTTTFTVAPGSELRLQQLLAQLGYLPLDFVPVTQPTSPQQTADPQQGSFVWRWANQPASLTSLWSPGTTNAITRGAVINFQSQHDLDTDGIAGPKVWGALLQAAAAGEADPQPYDYVYVSKSSPESATVYQNGSVVYTTPANTGLPGADTADGTFPIYARYETTTMSGTNLDGSHYSDAGVPWVSYFNGGDALHGFKRPTYGSPQSLGCVEMPYDNAHVVWDDTAMGSLVTVAG